MVSSELALKEVERWMDFKNTRPKIRKENAGAIESIASFIEDDLLVLEEDFTFTYSLQTPVETKGDNGSVESSIDEIKFKPRMKVMELKNSMRNIDAKNPVSMMIGIAAELTGKPAAFFDHLDSEDWGLIQNICLFFMPR